MHSQWQRRMQWRGHVPHPSVKYDSCTRGIMLKTMLSVFASDLFIRFTVVNRLYRPCSMTVACSVYRPISHHYRRHTSIVTILGLPRNALYASALGVQAMLRHSVCRTHGLYRNSWTNWAGMKRQWVQEGWLSPTERASVSAISLRYILAYPGYAPGTIAVNVTWMERGFNAGQTHSRYTHVSSTVYEL